LNDLELESDDDDFLPIEPKLVKTKSDTSEGIQQKKQETQKENVKEELK
jgi:hypothetical protein